MIHRIFILTVCCLLFQSLFAQDQLSYSISSGERSVFIGNYSTQFIDSSNALSVFDIVKQEFVEQDRDVVFFGQMNYNCWVKTSLINTTDDITEFYLNLDYALIDTVTFYSFKQDRLIDSLQITSTTPINERTLGFQSFIYPIKLANQDTVTIYSKLSSNKSMLFPAFVADYQTTMDYHSKNRQLFYLYLGLIIAVFSINLFIFISIKEKLYLFYCFMVGSISITQMITFGFDLHILPSPESGLWAEYRLQIMATFADYAVVLFGVVFLQMKKVNLWVYRLSYVFYSISTIGLIAILMGDGVLAMRIIDINNSLSVLYLLIIPSLSIRKKVPSAVYYLIAASVLCMGIIIYILQDVGVLQRTLFTTYIMPVGSGLEAILISFALGDRLRRLLSEKSKLQSEVIQTLEEKNFELEKVQGMKYQMNLLRRRVLLNQLNPHFIFNALNSINNFMLKNDRLEASRYLSKFSSLMRNFLESSKENFITLEKELSLIGNYLELEELRSSGEFNYKVEVDESLPIQKLFIPSSVIQPIVENAILHGIKSRTDKDGNIVISIQLVNRLLKVTVSDNGIGYDERVKETKRAYSDSTLAIIAHKIDLSNEEELHGNGFKISKVDETDKEYPGTKVEIQLKVRSIEDIEEDWLFSDMALNQSKS